MGALEDYREEMGFPEGSELGNVVSEVVRWEEASAAGRRAKSKTRRLFGLASWSQGKEGSKLQRAGPEHAADNIDSHVLAALLAGQRLPDASRPLSPLVLTIARGVDMPGKRGNGGSKTESHLPGSQNWQAVPPAAWPRPTLHTPASFLRLCHFTLQTTDFKEGLARCVLIAEWEWERLEAGS